MSKTRDFLDRLHPLFAKGGKFEKYYAVYEWWTPSFIRRRM